MLSGRCVLMLPFAAAALAGCHGWAGQTGADAHRGRYAGVGIYAPGEGWRRQVAGQGPTTGPAARLVDDEAVIVVVDSQTGEVRGCGDLSGYCVGLNPWRTALARPQQTPVDLTAHVTPAEDGVTNDADNAAAAAPSR